MQMYLIDLSELGLGELGESIPAEPDLLMKAVLDYLVHAETDKLDDLLDSLDPFPGIGMILANFDAWYCEKMERLEELFAHLKGKDIDLDDLRIENNFLYISAGGTW